MRADGASLLLDASGTASGDDSCTPKTSILMPRLRAASTNVSDDTIVDGSGPRTTRRIGR